MLNEEGHTIRVINYSFTKSVDYSEIFNERLVFEWGNIEIKEGEFNEAFNQVLEALKQNRYIDTKRILKPFKTKH